MAKGTITLPDGTQVIVEGTTAELKALLSFYSQRAQPNAESNRRTPNPKAGRAAVTLGTATPGSTTVDLTEIVNLAKSCDEAEAIESSILDKPGQLERVLLPLYIVHNYLDGALGLTSGEIAKITVELRVPVSQPNASKTLSGAASKYVIGDKVRVKGGAVRYKLSRRGDQYLRGVLKAATSE